MNNIYISHAYFQLLQRYLHRQNRLDVLSSAHQAQLEQLAQQNPLNKAPLTLLNAMLHDVESAKMSDTLYWDIAQNLELKHFGLVGYISSHAENLFEATQYIEKYGSLIIESQPETSIHLAHNTREAMLTWPRWQAECTALNEINLFSIHRMIQQYVPQPDAHYLRIEVAHTPQMPIKYYQNIFNCPVIFNSPHYAFVYAQTSLNTALAQPDQTLIDLLSQQAEQYLAQQNPTQLTLKQQIEALLLPLLKQGLPLPNIQQLAQRFHLSVRSLQRKLAMENLIYRQLIEQLRMQVCLQLLQQQQMTFTDLALHLGYADQSSLGRAFKKNFGHSLGQYAMVSAQSGSKFVPTTHHQDLDF